MPFGTPLRWPTIYEALEGKSEGEGGRGGIKIGVRIAVSEVLYSVTTM